MSPIKANRTIYKRRLRLSLLGGIMSFAMRTRGLRLIPMLISALNVATVCSASQSTADAVPVATVADAPPPAQAVAVPGTATKPAGFVSIPQCLAAAYPETVRALDGAVQVGERRIALRSSAETDYERRLNDAGLIDQLAQPYPLDFAVPEGDPGRMRDADFFDAMYGATKAQVRANLVKTPWAPSGGKVRFNRVNGASEALAAVGLEIAQDPELARYVARTHGTFNYRVVAGTTRKSPHSYGTAIDFKLPHELGMYWRWSGCKPGQDCPYPTRLLEDPKLRRVVAVFEKHGFIWGGKWRHYDSIHFEYRPELLRPECRPD